MNIATETRSQPQITSDPESMVQSVAGPGCLGWSDIQGKNTAKSKNLFTSIWEHNGLFMELVKRLLDRRPRLRKYSFLGTSRSTNAPSFSFLAGGFESVSDTPDNFPPPARSSGVNLLPPGPVSNIQLHTPSVRPSKAAHIVPLAKENFLQDEPQLPVPLPCRLARSERQRPKMP